MFSDFDFFTLFAFTIIIFGAGFMCGRMSND